MDKFLHVGNFQFNNIRQLVTLLVLHTNKHTHTEVNFNKMDFKLYFTEQQEAFLFVFPNRK